MATVSNIPREIQDSVREALDRRVKLSIKRMVRQELRSDKVENKILAFSACRLFILTAKVPSKVDFSFHYLDLQAIESKKPNQLSVTVADKTHVFRTLEADTEEVNHMITHVGLSLKQIFPGFPIERLIKKLEVSPPERLKVMYNMMKDIEKKDSGPCGGFSHMYACMCDYHLLPYREEVSWDVDTIYLSQDSRELCLKDFDHLDGRDLIPVISALEHNEWFTKLNINNVKLVLEAYSEILKVVLKNGTLEELHLSNTGIKLDFVQKLSTALLSNSGSQLTKLDLSHNLLEDRGLLHLTGALVKISKGLTYLDLTKTGVTGKSLSKLAEALSANKCMTTSLQTLILADNSLKGDESATQALFNFLAQPNSITHLDLTNTEVPLDGLSAALLRGCAQSLVHLNLSNNIFTVKKTKEVLIPSTWKNFFASAYSLQWLNLSGNRLPPEAIKELLLGFSSNIHIKSLHLNLSGNEMKTQGAKYLESVISHNTNINSLDISDNGLEQDLCSLLSWIQQNKSLNKLAIGRNFSGIKPKQISSVLESVVQLIQDEDSVLESLSLADAKLKLDTGMIINALGSNSSLTEIDISGNHMGDFGARMLSKALQINTKLRSVYWDRNNTSVQGFEDIASALEKNYTLRKMPVPVNDASVALKLYPERMEAAVQKIESLLQRNHSPRKFSSDQAYRLQQGFLISSTQQLVDRLVVQVQDTINALNHGSVVDIQNDLDSANDLMKDAGKSRQLLPRLHDISMKSQDSGNPVHAKLTSMAKELGEVLERHLQSTVEGMLKSTESQCVTVMGDKEFKTTLKEDCQKKSSLPPNFAKFLLDGVETDVSNKLSECNLSVAARISDRVMDEVIDNLSKSHKILTNHLNVQKSSVKRETTKTPKETKNEVNVITITEEDKEPGKMESPGLAEKRKSLYQIRKQRPQSVVDRKFGSDISTSDRKTSINTLKEDADLDPEKEEGKSRVNSDAPPSGAVENLEYKGHNLDLMTLSVTSVSEDSLEDVTDHKPAEKVHIDSLDVLPELSNIPKLSHVNKARPKRAKAHAVSRPMTKPANLVDDEALQTPTTNSFFETKSNPAPSNGHGGPGVSKTDENENEKTPTSSKPEKRKWSPFAKEKKSGKSGFASGFSNLFSRKQSGQPKLTRDEKRASENAKIDKKSSITENSKSNGPTFKEKEESEIAAEAESPSSPPLSTTTTTTSSPEEPIKSPSKLPPGRGPLLMGGNLLAEMKQKRGTAEKPSEKKDTKVVEAEAKSSTEFEPQITKRLPEEPKVNKRFQEEPKVTKLTPEEPKITKPLPEPVKVLPEAPNQSNTSPVEVKGQETPVEILATKLSLDEAIATKPSLEPARTNSSKSSQENNKKEPSEEVKGPTAKGSETANIESKKPLAELGSAILKSPMPSENLTENSKKEEKVSTEVKAKSGSLRSPVASPVSPEPKRDSGSSVMTETPKTTTSLTKETKPEAEPKMEAPKPKAALLPPAKRPTPKPRTAKPSTETDSANSLAVKRISKPPPPLPGSKPKPPPMKPRLSGIKSGSDESDKTTSAPVDKAPPSSMSSPSGIVYDSSTLRLSVKGKIKKLGLEKKIEEEREKSKPNLRQSSQMSNSAHRESPQVSADLSDSRPVSVISSERSPRTSAISPDNPRPLSANGIKDPMTVSQSDSPNSIDDKSSSEDTNTKPNQSKGSTKRASLAEEEVIYI